MSVQHPASWQDLFASGGPAGPVTTVSLRVIERSGRPFLGLPSSSRAAASGLSLYAAQTSRARLAKSFLALALKLKLPLGLPKVSLSIAQNDPFAALLAKMAGRRETPRFAILSGNPDTDGQRFILLLFDEHDEPVAVVKAGIGEAARRLVEHEASFLKSVSAGTAGILQVRDDFISPRVRALALDYFSGNSPGADDSNGVERTLSTWIDNERQANIGELAAWKRLIERGPHLPGWAQWRALENANCHPVIYHGDFTPWNIKVADDRWHVLDWERGELAGIPGWDWFHYVIQNAVLVRREAIPALAGRVEALLGSPNFARYATRAGITGMERLLALAYLNHSIQILKQTEELPRVQGLLNCLSERWLSNQPARVG